VPVPVPLQARLSSFLLVLSNSYSSKASWFVTATVTMMPCTGTACRSKASRQEDANSRVWGSQKQIWGLEQQIVGTLVQVHPDPPPDHSIIADNALFHLVKDDHHDVFSFSSKPELYGGVDVSFPENDEDLAVAVYVIVDKRTMEVVYHDHEYFMLQVPYISGYLAFREIQPLEELIQRQLHGRPDMTPNAILVDGNGIFHPRHAGIACFVGNRTNIPTIGVGKSLFCEAGWTHENMDEAVDHFLGEMYQGIRTDPKLATSLSRYRGLVYKKTCAEPAAATTASFSSKPLASDHRKRILQELAPFCNGLGIPLKGADNSRFPVLACALVGHGGQIAASAKSQPVGGTTKPIWISVGHKISLLRAVQICASLSMARIPEPIRQADLMGRRLMSKRNPSPDHPPAKRRNTETMDF
jgi:deoxyinosine 3'endonuclease (endonuclease V)